MSKLSLLQHPRRWAAVAVVAVLAMVGGGIAYAASPAIHTFTPRSEHQITNIDVLRQQIRNYYGDHSAPACSTADGNYAKEAEGVARQGERYLQHPVAPARNKAILLDVDDTTLATWNYEVASNWAFNPTTNGEFVTDQKFPAVPGMVDLVDQAAAEGYAIFFLTGRGAAQEPATLGQPDRRRGGRGRRLPGADDPQRRRGRAVHEAGRGGLPRLPQGGLRRRCERELHHGPLQVRDPSPHRVARLRHRGQLR